MTHRPWTHVVDDPAARHLVVARLAPKAADEPAALMKELIESLHPVGDFSLLTRCEEECAVLLCAFTHPQDARILAQVVEAFDTDNYSEWASHCAFALDRDAAQRIAHSVDFGMMPPLPHAVPTTRYAHH